MTAVTAMTAMTAMTIDLTAPPVLLPLPGFISGVGGGVLKSVPEDFEVDEIPAYEPSGEGDFLYLHVEKRDISGPVLVREVSRRLGVDRGDVGCAGMKDRRAVTRQWISVPAAGVDPSALDGPFGDTGALRLLESRRHTNKLRTGHLSGNRFGVRLRDRAPADDAELERAVAEVAADGFVNSFGPQRFSGGQTVQLGLDLLKGKRIKDRRMRRLAVSAVQSSLFNHWCARRVADGLAKTVIAGDVVRKRETGGMFVSEDAAVDQARLDAGELLLTGPMYGARYRASTGASLERDAALLVDAGLPADAFQTLGKKLAPGTRRDFLVIPTGVGVVRDALGVMVRFTLPAGSYATVLLGLAAGASASDAAGP